jgi:hypothetical protein
MEYYALLTVSTVVIAVLAAAVYRKSRDVGTLVGIAALYYWSLFGAWFIVIDKTGGFSGKHYQYLESKLFPIVLDRDYLLALGLYAGFLIVVQVTLLIALSRGSGARVPGLPQRLILRHEPILAVSFAAAAASIVLMQDKLSAAWSLNTSAYIYTRSQTDDWFTLHQLLNRVALLPAAIGLATLLAGERSRFFVSVRRRYVLPGYLLLLGGMGMFTFMLGNKNEVLTTLLAGVLAYVGSVRKPNWIKVGLTVAAGLWFLNTIDFFRAVPLAGMEEAVSGRWDEASEVGRFLTSSNEAYGAHFSMYGVLAAGVEPKFGYSLYSLACSVIPRALWKERPLDIYFYYSESVGAIQNQGYSLHHATGWYLNFGYFGVVVGAVALGLVWAYSLNANGRVRPPTGLLFRLYATVAPWLFVACLPSLVRAGPEAYKGFLLEGVLIPVGVLALSCRPKKARKKLVWSQERGWALAGVANR